MTGPGDCETSAGLETFGRLTVGGAGRHRGLPLYEKDGGWRREWAGHGGDQRKGWHAYRGAGSHRARNNLSVPETPLVPEMSVIAELRPLPPAIIVRGAIGQRV